MRRGRSPAGRPASARGRRRRSTSRRSARRAPTASAASSVVNSSPSPPGVSRLQMKRELGTQPAARCEHRAKRTAPLHPRGQPAPVLRLAQEPGDHDQRRRSPRPRSRTRAALARRSRWPCRGSARGSSRAGRSAAAHSPVPRMLYGAKCAVAHARAAGDERRQRPDQPDEAPDQDRLAAVAGEVALDLLEALGRDPQPSARGGRTNSRPSRARAGSSSCRPAKAQTQMIAMISGSRSRPGRRPRRRASPSTRQGRPARRTRPSRGTRARRPAR